MMNVVEEDEVDEADDSDEPPAKKAAVTSTEEEFDLLLGRKDDEVIGTDNYHIEDEYQRYIKEAEINFRKDDPIDWWRKHESYFPHVDKLARKLFSYPSLDCTCRKGFLHSKKHTAEKTMESSTRTAG